MHSFWPIAIILLLLVIFSSRRRADQLLKEKRQREQEQEAERLKAEQSQTTQSQSKQSQPAPPQPEAVCPSPQTSTAARPTESENFSLAADMADDKLASDHTGQLKQALALRSAINALEAEFSALQENLPKGLHENQQDPQSKEIAHECMIAREQLRITQSYCNELMRFVMAPFQDAASRPYYVPTQDQAAWAFTAAKLTLGFAQNRIRSIKSIK